ncbi:MAG: class I tRNA ligase family protein, partial [Candidatus Acidiferrales bacterium]
ALPHEWIFSRLAAVTAQMNDALENFRFHEAAHVIYHFFWGDFCDWYIEWLKPQLASENREDAIATWRNLFAAFEYALRLLHPFMPFITEELWHRLPQNAGTKSISLQSFPEPHAEWVNPEAERSVALVQEIVVAARNIRAEIKLDTKKKVAADFASQYPEVRNRAAENLDVILRLGSLSTLNIQPGKLTSGEGAVRSTSQFDLRIQFEGGPADAKAETEKLKKEKERLEKDVALKRQRLADDTFRNRAPAEIVRGLEATLAERQIEYQKVVERLSQLE